MTAYVSTFVVFSLKLVQKVELEPRMYSFNTQPRESTTRGSSTAHVQTFRLKKAVMKVLLALLLVVGAFATTVLSSGKVYTTYHW